MTAGAAGIIASDGMAGRLYAAPQSRSGRTQINPDIPDTRVVCCHDPSMVTDIGADGFTQQNNAVDTARVVADMDAMACALAGRPRPVRPAPSRRRIPGARARRRPRGRAHPDRGITRPRPRRMTVKPI